VGASIGSSTGTAQLCLDVEGAGTTNQTNILQWTCNAGTNQQFQIISVP
jgi:hypothetical protein